MDTPLITPTNQTMDLIKPINYFESGFNLKRFLIWLALVFIIAYGLFNARNLIFGPSIDIINPPLSEFETKENTITIKGKVENVSYLSLNEKQITVDTDGYFEEAVLLSPSFNTIEIKAMDRFKNETKKILKIYLLEKTESNLGDQINNLE